MSIAAIGWAFNQEIKPSSLKFLLLALADNVGDEDGIAWPSLPELERKTCQDRKTIIAGLDALEDLGFLEDTGQRCGATRQIKVYRVIGLPTSRHHYTYRITHKETGEFYLGVRSCTGDPLRDPYMGSGAWPQRQPRRLLIKEILATFATRAEAEADEIQRIRAAAMDPACMNKAGRKPNVPQAAKANSTVFPTETVPFFPGNSTVFPEEQYRKRDTEPSMEPSGTNTPPSPTAPAGKQKVEKKSKPHPEHQQFIADWCDYYQRKYGCKYPCGPRDAKAAKELLQHFTTSDAAKAFIKSCHKREREGYPFESNVKTLYGLANNLAILQAALTQPPRQNGHSRTAPDRNAGTANEGVTYARGSRIPAGYAAPDNIDDIFADCVPGVPAPERPQA